MSRLTPPFWLRAALAVAVLHVLLLQPNLPSAVGFAALWHVPLELPVILLAMMAMANSAASRIVRGVLVALLTAIFVLRTADLVMFSALGRRFNPVADMPLIDASFRLLSGTFGPLAAVGVAVCALLLVAAVAAAAWWATGIWARVTLPAAGRGMAAAGCAAAAFMMIADAVPGGRGWTKGTVPGDAFAVRFAAGSVQQARQTVAGLRDFAIAARQDDFAGADGLLDAIDRDVLVIFIESYGRASLDTPFYAERHRATLEQASVRLSGLGLATRSAYLQAPTRGGQSWLSHASFADGLWINDQTRYLAALASDRESLFHIAARSGFHTATVSPAITMAWPEAAQMGFETVLAAADLGYRGKPFNWVTMPDQFTLAAADRLLRSGQGDRPVFAEVALISSHAPWVPVPELLDWESLGDGRVFDAMATSGDPPEVVWRDPARVRQQYRKALDYALRTVFDYAARHAGDPPLMIVLGDHQTAGHIALDERPDVPVHLIGPPSLVERTVPWGWREGLVPATEPVVPMNRMRDMILRAFSTGAGLGADLAAGVGTGG